MALASWLVWMQLLLGYGGGVCSVASALWLVMLPPMALATKSVLTSGARWGVTVLHPPSVTMSPSL